MKKLGIIILLLMVNLYLINDYVFYSDMYITTYEHKDLDIKENDNNIVLNKETNNNIKKESKVEVEDNKEVVDNKVIVKNEESNKTIIDLDIERDLKKTEKYGTTITEINEIKTYTYEDLTKEEIKDTYYQYEYNFNATSNDLVDEARKLVNNNLEIAKMILDETNKIRAKVNSETLEMDTNLSLAASMRALELAYSKKLEHIRPNSKRWNTILDDLNIEYGYAGENIGWNYKSAKEVMVAWQKSNGHYLNMINNNYHKIGIGYVNLNGLKYYVQIFKD